MQTVIPPPRLRETFGELVGPPLRRIAEVFSESQTLSQLLNTLLPKLISGELRVAETERVLAASA
jgi:type I restriction enzyme S subunit